MIGSLWPALSSTQSPTTMRHRTGLLSLELDLLVGSDLLPGFQDWVAALCECISCFAIAVSFFKAADDEADAWLSTTFILGSLSSIWMSTAALVFLPRICATCCGNSRRGLLHHPHYPATVQLLKFVLFGAVFAHLVLRATAHDRTHSVELKRNQEVVAPLILAACDALLSLNTVVSTYVGKDFAYTTRRSKARTFDYPRSRRSRAWIFVNLWKDYGMLATMIKVDDTLLLALLLVNVLPTTFSSRYLWEHEITSQHRRYHLYRALLVLSNAVGMCVGTVPFNSPEYSYFAFVADQRVPMLLLGCEVVLALCEVRNGARTDSSAATPLPSSQ